MPAADGDVHTPPRMTGGRARVDPIAVIVAETRRDVIADLVANALRGSGDFVLLHPDVPRLADLPAILDRLATPPEVLVVIGEAADRAPADLTARHPDLIVSRLSIGSDIVDLELRTVGIDHLLATLRSLARADRAAHQAPPPTTVAFPALPTLPPRAADPAVALNAAMQAYIDAALLRHLRARPGIENEIPGCGRSRATLEALLAPAVGGDAAPVDVAWANVAALLDGDASAEPLALLRCRLGLAEDELQALVLCLAPELDIRYHPVFGVFVDDLGRQAPSLGLVSALLGDRGETPIVLARQLARWRLLAFGDALPLAGRTAAVDAALSAWLLGDRAALLGDPRLAACLRYTPWPGSELLRRPADAGERDRLAHALATRPTQPGWLLMLGDDPSGWRALAESAGADSPPIRVQLDGFSQLSANEVDDAAVRVVRAACLLDRPLVVDAGDADPAAVSCLGRLAGAAVALPGPALLILREAAPFLAALRGQQVRIFGHRSPTGEVTATAFRQAAAAAELSLTEGDSDRLASAFPLALPAIVDAVRLAALDPGPAGGSTDFRARIAAAARRIASPALPRFAQRVVPIFSLDQVVLPPEAKAQLTALVGHVVHARQVLDGWGFAAQLPYGRGIAALFHGPSGTGKTMAAHAIARALDTEVFIVDLSRVVSKYIGESEKNLDAVFAEAEQAGAILVFDEADALFAKRSEVKDSRDRYANMEVAYLLQRVDSFAGLAVLTTNLRQNLDPAFFRRMRFVVEFPKPNAADRERIWAGCLPAAAPLAADVDLAQLARRIEVTGGNIRQITLGAAFAAAAAGAPVIGMRHLLDATRAELIKLGQATQVRNLDEFERCRPAAAAA